MLIPIVVVVMGRVKVEPPPFLFATTTGALACSQGSENPWNILRGPPSWILEWDFMSSQGAYESLQTAWLEALLVAH